MMPGKISNKIRFPENMLDECPLFSLKEVDLMRSKFMSPDILALEYRLTISLVVFCSNQFFMANYQEIK